MSNSAGNHLETLKKCQVILGNSNPRFSGVSSTMLQTLEHQNKQINICVLGAHHLPENLKHLACSFFDIAKLRKFPLVSGLPRVFHARRNDEMIQALILKYIFKVKLKIIFTSTAQRFHSRFTCWLMAKVDYVISTCKAAASYLKQPPAVLVPHGIQSNIYFPGDRWQAGDQIRIGMFGRVRHQKGTHLLVEAGIKLLPLYPKASIDVVGSITSDNKEYVRQLQVKIDEAKLTQRIRFLGEQKFEEIPALFRQMHIVTALSETEGFGLTVLEAMSSGAAVLTTEAGAWPDIVKPGENGYVVPINDQQAVTELLQTMLAKPEDLSVMGAAGRALILQKYKIEDEAQKLCEIYSLAQQNLLSVND